MGDHDIRERMGVEAYALRRYKTLARKDMAQIYEAAAKWCDREGSNLDLFVALDVVGYPVWDGLQHVKTLEDMLWACGSKYSFNGQERATLLCLAAAVERQGW